MKTTPSVRSFESEEIAWKYFLTISEEADLEWRVEHLQLIIWRAETEKKIQENNLFSCVGGWRGLKL